MGKSWEAKYFEDILPEIEEYTGEATTSFRSSDIAERLEDYTPQKVGKTLKYMTDQEETNHIIPTGNNPKTWEAVFFQDTAWERLAYEMDLEPEHEHPEEIAEEVLEENPEEEEEGLYTQFIDRLQENDHFTNTADSIRKMREIAERNKPEVDPEIRNLSAQEYGKIRSNLGDVYEGLKEINQERNGYFKARDLKDKVNNTKTSEIGLVLSSLATAGILGTYGDRELYEPDSIELDDLREFRRAVNSAEHIEELQKILDFKEED